MSNNPDKQPRTMVRPQLMSYFRRHPGVTVWLDDICNELKITNPRKVQQGIGNMRQDEQVIGAYIQVVRPGQAWRYMPPAQAEEAVPAQAQPPQQEAVTVTRDAGNELWERLGNLKDGGTMLRDEAGDLWRAERM